MGIRSEQFIRELAPNILFDKINGNSSLLIGDLIDSA